MGPKWALSGLFEIAMVFMSIPPSEVIRGKYYAKQGRVVEVRKKTRLAWNSNPRRWYSDALQTELSCLTINPRRLRAVAFLFARVDWQP